MAKIVPAFYVFYGKKTTLGSHYELNNFPGGKMRTQNKKIRMYWYTEVKYTF